MNEERRYQNRPPPSCFFFEFPFGREPRGELWAKGDSHKWRGLASNGNSVYFKVGSIPGIQRIAFW